MRDTKRQSIIKIIEAKKECIKNGLKLTRNNISILTGIPLTTIKRYWNENIEEYDLFNECSPTDYNTQKYNKVKLDFNKCEFSEEDFFNEDYECRVKEILEDGFIKDFKNNN